MSFKAYKEKQNALIISQKEKKELQKRLELAKIEQQKMQILRQKEQIAKEQESLEQTKSTPKPQTEPKFLINSSLMNAKKMQKEFAKNKNANTALKLANFYLAKKEYKEAMKWSILANDLAKDEAEAWQIYIKSLIALGQKEQALRVYESYKNRYALQNPAFAFKNFSSKELR